jgi:hypothetical protein
MYKIANLSPSEIQQILSDAKALTDAPYTQLNFQKYIIVLRKLIVAIIENKEIPEKNKRVFTQIQTVAKQRTFKGDAIRKPFDALVNALVFWNTWDDIDTSKTEGDDFFKIDTLKIRILSPITEQKMEAVKNVISLAVVKINRSTIPNFKNVLNDLNVYITNSKKTKTLAWYNTTHDDIYIQEAYLKTGVRNDLDSVHDFIHEVGHRFYQKFLTDDQKKEWAKVYRQTLIRQKMMHFIDDLPKIGESLRDTLKINVVDKKRNPIYPDDKVVSIEPSIQGKIYTLSNGFKILEKTILNFTGVPSEYSKKNEEEFFCETLGLFLTKDLRPQLTHLKEKFLEIFKGGRGEDDSVTASIKRKRY